MPVGNSVGQADNLLVDRQHRFWNRVEASGTGHRISPVEKVSRFLLVDRDAICTIRRVRERDILTYDSKMPSGNLSLVMYYSTIDPPRAKPPDPRTTTPRPPD